MAVDLFGIFDGLRPPENAPGLRFAAVPIPGFEMHRIGKDAESNASLLISSSPTNDVVTAPIVLEHLTIQYDVECTITHPDGTTEIGVFSLIRCTDLEPALERYFLRIAGALVAELGPSPRRSDVATAIGRLVALFRAIQAAPRQTAQGLWAELLVIAGARSPSRLVAAWHVLPDDLYDFSEMAERIEVKSASGRVRRHRFALDQLAQASPARVLIASILVERAGAGVSLGELVSEIRQSVRERADLLLRVDEVVITTLGNSWRASLAERFDREFAERSLSFYSAADIPTVPTPLPHEVSDVHFSADLSGITTVDLGRVRRDGDLFSAAARR
jgi:putative PD-(D/E)XK family protein DUF4420